MKERNTSPTLNELQKWIQAKVTQSPLLDQLPDYSSYIPASRGFSSDYRLGTYSTSWYLRLEESLEEDYEIFADLIGKSAFSRLVKSYLTHHPSSYFTLAHVGDHVPEFLQHWEDPSLKGWHTDLAQLERAYYQTFYCKDSELADPNALAQLPPEEGELVLLKIEPSVVLLASRWDILPVWKERTKVPKDLNDSIDSRHTQPSQIKMKYLLIYRKDFEVRVERLTIRSYSILKDLETGMTLGVLFDKYPYKKTVELLSEWASSGIIRPILGEKS